MWCVPMSGLQKTFVCGALAMAATAPLPGISIQDDAGNSLGFWHSLAESG